LKKVFVTTLCLLPLTGVAAETHCIPDEKVVFSCSVGKKTVSICSSPKFSVTDGYLQYRFGVPGKVEMTFPEAKIHPKGKFEVNRMTPTMDDGSRADLIELTFKNGDYGYLISSLATSKSSDVSLVVSKADKTVATLKCQGKTVIKSDLSFFDVLTEFGIDQ